MMVELADTVIRHLGEKSKVNVPKHTLAGAGYGSVNSSVSA
jgi:hypothetical protein